jgi:hypothetical protein
MMFSVRLLVFMCAAVGAVAPVYGQHSTNVQRVAVVRLQFQGDVPEGHRAAFASRLVEGLAVAAFQVSSGPGVERKLVATGKLDKCADGDCYPKVADALDVGYLVVGTIGESNKNYEISLEIINGRTGATIGNSREHCETCGMAEAAEKVGLAASALRTRLEALSRTPSRVVLRSRPSGAMATVDGKVVGTTPTDLELSGGVHQLVLQSEGYNRVERSFTVVSGVDETLTLEMLKPPSKFNYRAWGWTAVAGGAVLVAAAIYAGAVDGKLLSCSANERDSNGRCPKIRDTDGIALGLMAAGVATATMGGVWIWIASQQAPSDDAPRSQANRVIGLGYQGRF